MGALLKKLKAALGIGAIWGVAAGAVGAVLGGVSGLLGGALLTSLVTFASGAGIAGLVLGTGFGVLLSTMEGRRTLDELTPNRAALWGLVVGTFGIAGTGGFLIAVGGMSVPMGAFLTALSAGAVCYGALTGLLAAGTVWLAKRDTDELGSGTGGAAEHLVGSGQS